MKFNIDDTPSDCASLPEQVRKVVDILSSLPDGKLLTLYGVAERLCVTSRTAYEALHHSAAKQFRCKQHGKMKCLYGNPRTIEAYVKANQTH